MNEFIRPTRKIRGAYSEISERLRLVRSVFGLTQKEFAELAGLSQPTYTSWESGKNRISVSGAIKLRAKYSVTLDFIYCGNVAGMPEDLLNKLAKQSRLPY